MLTSEERVIIDLLAQCWNKFIELSVQHPSHNQDFAQYIHQAQQLVMSRSVSREEGWVKPDTFTVHATLPKRIDPEDVQPIFDTRNPEWWDSGVHDD